MDQKILEKEQSTARNEFVTNYPHYRHWRKNIVPQMFEEKPINIYLHVPFCIQRCNYCYYLTTIYKNQEQLSNFVDNLVKEIKIGAEKLNIKGRSVNSIYFGGGTPSLLKPNLLKRIVDCLNENFKIDRPEFTIECEPRMIKPKLIETYNEIGASRLSLGVQSFNNEIVKISGRGHTSETVFDAIKIIREGGEYAVNIDLLSGLPGDSLSSWIDSVKTAISLNTENLTIYKMQNYANTVFFDQSIRNDKIHLISDSEEFKYMSNAIDILEKSQYQFWSNFTFINNEQYIQQYILNIWGKDEDCCCFGPSGYGKIGDYCYQNTNNTEAYLQYLDKNELPINRGYQLNTADKMVRDIILQFKFNNFNLEHFISKHGIDFTKFIPTTFEYLLKESFININNSNISLTSKGILHCDYVGMKLASSLREKLQNKATKIY